jgi:hypothetical protein
MTDTKTTKKVTVFTRRWFELLCHKKGTNAKYIAQFLPGTVAEVLEEIAKPEEGPLPESWRKPLTILTRKNWVEGKLLRETLEPFNLKEWRKEQKKPAPKKPKIVEVPIRVIKKGVKTTPWAEIKKQRKEKDEALKNQREIVSSAQWKISKTDKGINIHATILIDTIEIPLTFSVDITLAQLTSATEVPSKL